MNTLKLIDMLPVERWLFNGSTKGDEYVNGVSITKGDNIELSNEVIRSAMFYLYKRHPLFRAHIHLNINAYFAIPADYEKTEDDMVFERFQLSSRNQLIPELEEFSAKILDYENKCLLWRLGLFEYQTDDNKNVHVFALIVPMYMTDGINITTLSIELVNIINSLLKNQTCLEMIEHLELIENVQQIAEKHNLFNDKVKEEVTKLKEKELGVIFNLPNKFMSLEDSGSRINFLALDVESTKKLVIFAKEHKLKLTGMLTTAIF